MMDASVYACVLVVSALVSMLLYKVVHHLMDYAIEWVIIPSPGTPETQGGGVGQK